MNKQRLVNQIFADLAPTLAEPADDSAAEPRSVLAEFVYAILREGQTRDNLATTSTAISVACAPRARMAVNASWPGVSRKVTFCPFTSTW